MGGGWLGQIGKVALSYIHSVQCCGSAGKESACNAGDLGSITGLGNPLEKGKATHSSILAWRIPQTVQPMGLQRVRHDWVNFIFTFQFQLCPTLYYPMDCSMPGFPVHHQLLKLAQTHVRVDGDAIQPSDLLLFSSPSAFLSQHQGLSRWVISSHQVAKLLELQLQHQSFQWTPRTDLL